MRKRYSRQGGATLFVGMVMLLVLTMMVITGFTVSKSNLQIVANTRDRHQVYVAALSAVQQVISNTQFATTPSNAVPSPCNGIANTICFDTDGDGTNDVSVNVTPTCIATKIIPISSLDLTNANDQACLVGVAQTAGIDGSTSNNSMCANMVWNIQAVATDLKTKAQFIVNQGTAVRVQSTAVCP